MSEPAQSSSVALPSSCPRCGRAMTLPLPADCDRADAERLARLILCSHCAPEPGQTWDLTENLSREPEQPEARTVRLPYADD